MHYPWIVKTCPHCIHAVTVEGFRTSCLDFPFVNLHLQIQKILLIIMPIREGFFLSLSSSTNTNWFLCQQKYLHSRSFSVVEQITGDYNFKICTIMKLEARHEAKSGNEILKVGLNPYNLFEWQNGWTEIVLDEDTCCPSHNHTECCDPRLQTKWWHERAHVFCLPEWDEAMALWMISIDGWSLSGHTSTSQVCDTRSLYLQTGKIFMNFGRA